MPVLTRQQISDTLDLKDPESIGDILESLMIFYQAAGHKFFSAEGEMPSFVRRALGPALENLPSYASLDQKYSHPDEIGLRVQGKGVEGLGEVMDVAHAEMRLVGSKIGRLFAPTIRALIPAHNLVGDRFTPSEVIHLKDRNVATVQLDKNTPPLHVNAKDILYLGFMMGAESRAHLSRTEEEREMLQKSVGVLKRSYTTLLKMISTVETAMRNDPAHHGKTPADYGLDMDMNKIAGAFHRRQREFSEAYNFIYTLSSGHIDERLQKLKWQIDGRKPPAAGIYTETPREVAAALSGLCHLAHSMEKDYHTDLCERIAQQSPRQAAKTLRESEIIEKLRFSAQGLDSHQSKTIEQVTQSLETFCERNGRLDQRKPRASHHQQAAARHR